MITYPILFFGAGGGPLKEDFSDYPAGDVVSHDQIWQHHSNQWLVPKNPTKYVGVTWRDYGVSGANDDFSSYDFGEISTSESQNLKGLGNFEKAHNGFSVGFYREPKGGFVSSDTIRGTDYINFDWGTDAPIENFKQDFWSAKFIGKLNLPIDGTYKFYVERDNSCRIFVGREDGPNLLVFDKWGVDVTNVLEEGYGFTFSAGPIDILIDFFDDEGDAKLKLYWSKPIVPGGSPVTPPEIILPSDFGNSGYIRTFCNSGPYSSPTNQSVDIYGSYQFGAPPGEFIYLNIGESLLDLSGSYWLGVSYADKLKQSLSNDLSYAGYYLERNFEIETYDSSNNFIEDVGFYTYHAATSIDADVVENSISAKDSFYANKLFTLRQLESNSERINAAGFYASGRVPIDDSREFVSNKIETHGFHGIRFVYDKKASDAIFLANVYGNYFPVHVHARTYDEAANIVFPSGYYISGYVNANYSDTSRGSVDIEGHRAYWMVTGDKVFESSINKNLLGIDYGVYFYRNVIDRADDSTIESLYSDGIYSSRYVDGNYLEQNKSEIAHIGAYYNIWAYSTPDDFVKNQVVPAGYFVYSRCDFKTDSFVESKISQAGYHVSGFVPRSYQETRTNEINSNGNYFFGVNFLRGLDAAKASINSQGLYFCIYSPNKYLDESSSTLSHSGHYYWRLVPHRSETVYARENMLVNGEYASRFFPYKFGVDFGQTSIDHYGAYITGRVHSRCEDLLKHSLSSAGNYFNRFSYGRGDDLAKISQFVDGAYLYKVLTSESSNLDASWASVNYAGLYQQLRVYSNQKDSLLGNLNAAGLYFGLRSPNKYNEPSVAEVGLDGEIFSRFVPKDCSESAFGDLGFAEAFYIDRFVPTDIHLLNARGYIAFNGEYLRESWITTDSTVFEINFSSETLTFLEKTELAVVTSDVSGSFVAAKVSSTMDYWLEIYRRPTYNMGKTQAYFSI